MIVSQEFKATIQECKEKIAKENCSLGDCSDCATINTAYYLRNYTIATPEKIEQLLGESAKS